MTPTKRCTRCHEEKPLDQFYHQAHSRDGHTYDCKACRNAAVYAYRARERAGLPGRAARTAQERAERGQAA